MEQRSKAYVSVVAEFREDGVILPRQVKWEDGRVFAIDRIREIRPAASLKTGGGGLRYRCVISGKETYLFLESGRSWFVEKKEYL